jgi:hypothetical protein
MHLRILPIILAAGFPGFAMADSGPQLGDTFRIVRPDGVTVIQQGQLSAIVLNAIDVSDQDAFLVSGGRCAFNVKYDETSAVAVTGTTNRLYSNDKLIAQNTRIDLAAGGTRTIWTQPYLAPGANNVRVVVNADGAQPSTRWIRVNVAGSCGAAPAAGAPAANTAPATNTVSSTSTTTSKPGEGEKHGTTTPAPAPAPTPVPAKQGGDARPASPPATPIAVPVPVVRYTPGTPQWNNLNLAWGYSNFATKQLMNAGYARYAELARLNAAITAAINAKTVDKATYDSLLASWNTFVNEDKFKQLMAAVLPGSDKK